MLVHLVLVKLKPGVSPTDPRVPAWEAKLKELQHKCPGIVRFECGFNFTDRPVAYDIGINMAFDTKENLLAYGPHPAHQEVVVMLREIADWIICDYEA